MRMKARNYGILNRSIARGISYGIRSYNWQKPVRQPSSNSNIAYPDANAQAVMDFLAWCGVIIFMIFIAIMVGVCL